MLRIFLPITCLACNRPFDRQKTASTFSNYLCPSCTRIFEHQATYSPDCSEKRFRFRNLNASISLQAAFEFKQGSIIQHLIHNAKYHSMMNLAETLGVAAATSLRPNLQQIDHIIPIPLHRTRYSERGYNQSEKIAAGFACTLTSATVLNKALLRVKPTPTQTGLSEEEREKNMNGAFELRSDSYTKIKDKTVVLVDDVLTTGATLASAAHELDKAGPKKIVVAAVALATDGGI